MEYLLHLAEQTRPISDEALMQKLNVIHNSFESLQLEELRAIQAYALHQRKDPIEFGRLDQEFCEVANINCPSYFFEEYPELMDEAKKRGLYPPTYYFSETLDQKVRRKLGLPEY